MKKIKAPMRQAHQLYSLGVDSEWFHWDLQARVRPEICFQGDHLE